jgi:glucose/arabinose dehydrogenase
LSGAEGLIIVSQNNESLIAKIKIKNPELQDTKIAIKAVIGETLFAYLIGISAEGCNRAALVSATTNRVATQFPCIAKDFDSNMVGGGFVENEDGSLYLALGDPARQWAKDGWKSFDNSLSQDPVSPYGKVLRVSNWADLDSETVLELKIFASGVRNPQGMTSTSNGDIFFTDHGATGGDELNILIEGKDYGWPLVSMGKTYSGVKFPNAYSVKTSPIYSWIPSIAPSDIVSCPRILSDRYKGLTCTIVSSLRGMSLFVVLTSGIQEQAKSLSVQKLKIGARVREVQASDSNSIEIFTDNGAHYKLTFSPN